jgi:N-acetylglucosamine-6-sulfatase
MHALRGQRYKYIHYHGIWDTDELYDLQADPVESKNLIASERHRDVIRDMNKRLFDLLSETQGMYIPLYRDSGRQQNLRLEGRSGPAPFPAQLMRKKPPQNKTPGERAPAGDPTKTGAPTDVRSKP